MKSLVFSAAIVACTFLPCQAQETGVREVLFDTLVTGVVQATPIGVDQMVYVGTEYIAKDDTTLMQYATQIVQRDLDFYLDFELIEVDPFYIKLYEIVDLDLFGWQRLGADYVVKLEAFPRPHDACTLEDIRRKP